MAHPLLTLKKVVASLLLAALFVCALPAGTAEAKGLGINAARGGVSLPGSPYRYVTLNPRRGDRIDTVVMRVEREGGRIDRWLRLRGQYYVPAPAYDLRGGGLSGDGGTLVLQRFTPAYPPRRSRFAVLDTADFLDYPSQSGGSGRAVRAVRRIELPGFYSLHAVSPDGKTAYLNHHLPRGRAIAGFELAAVDLASGRLMPSPAELRTPMEGLPITQVTSSDGRWAYTLYDGNFAGGGGAPFVLALDTVAGRTRRVELPQLGDKQTLFLTRMRLAGGGRSLAVFRDSPVQWRAPTPPLLTVDTETLAVSDARTALMALGRRLVTSFAEMLAPNDEPLLAFARTPRRPGNLLLRTGVVGRSKGRPVVLRQYGDPSWSGELLVVAPGRIQPLTNGCPDPSADIYLLPEAQAEPWLVMRVIRALDPEAAIRLGPAAGNRPLARSRLSKALVRIGRRVRED
jgi:hypothetical protein